MAFIKEISSTTNSKDIANILIDDDSCWFTNGVLNPLINLRIDGYVKSLYIKFHKGFHARRIYIKEIDKTLEFGDDKYEAKINIDKSLNEIEIVLISSYDPYNRYCIYFLKVDS